MDARTRSCLRRIVPGVLLAGASVLLPVLAVAQPKGSAAQEGIHITLKNEFIEIGPGRATAERLNGERPRAGIEVQHHRPLHPIRQHVEERAPDLV